MIFYQHILLNQIITLYNSYIWWYSFERTFL